MIPTLNRDICTGCENCIEVCPPRAICMENDKARIEEEFCEECGFCAAACPAEAITIVFPLSTD